MYKKSKTINFKYIEIIIYFIIWLSVFTLPYFIHRENFIVDWEKVIIEWLRLFAYLTIFTLNVYVLIPRFLFNKNYKLYITLSILTIIFVLSTSISLQKFLKPSNTLSMPPMEIGPGMPPMELGNNMPAPMGYRAPQAPIEKSLFMIIVDNLIIAFLVFAAGTTIKLMTRWLNEEQKRKDVEKEQLKTELALLRHQVSPHFFMNTLNNIHALIDINSDTAKDAVIRLSTLMRYLLYETSHGQTSLQKEIDFIESYIILMQLRFSKKVKITLDIQKKLPAIQIPPMLFITFIENAFKHGVSYQNESFVIFKLQLIDNQIICKIKNSKNKQVENYNKTYSGIGLTNIRKSLNLLFENDYYLNITENEKEFEVDLKIPIYNNNISI
jgi:hypothetical protein